MLVIRKKWHHEVGMILFIKWKTMRITLPNAMECVHFHGEFCVLLIMILSYGVMTWFIGWLAHPALRTQPGLSQDWLPGIIGITGKVRVKAVKRLICTRGLSILQHLKNCPIMSWILVGLYMKVMVPL